jgi:hypothetical protein
MNSGDIFLLKNRDYGYLLHILAIRPNYISFQILILEHLTTAIGDQSESSAINSVLFNTRL